MKRTSVDREWWPRVAVKSPGIAGWVRVALGLALLPCAVADAARVYYVNQPEGGLGRINSVQLDGAGHNNVYTTASVTDLRGIAVDPVAARLYFAYADSDISSGARTQVSIRSLPTQGGVPAIVTSLPDGTFVSDVEWDEINSWIYIAQTGDLQLRRVKPNGSQLATVITTVGSGSGPYFFGLDLRENLVYWGIGTQSGDTNTRYSRGSLITGQIDQTFSLTTPSRTRDIAVDHRAAQAVLYWCDRQNGAVYNRLADDGTIFVSRSGLNAPHGLMVDLEAGKGYVADTGKRGNNPSQPSAHRVVRFNLDGTGALEFLSPVDAVAEPWDLTLDLTSATYADWKTRFFSAVATDSALADDPDNDGLSNMAEYVFFTHPQRPDAALAATFVEGRDFKYARRKSSDIATRVEVSTDLQVWHWNGDVPGAVWTAEAAVSPRDADSVWVTVQASEALSGAHRLFYRLRAISPVQLAPVSQSAVKPSRALKKIVRSRGTSWTRFAD